MKKLLTLLLTLLLCLAPTVALADTSFDGSVVSTGASAVTAPFGGVVASLSVQAGDRVEVGDVVATIETTKVYASTSGTVTGLFIQTGDNVENVSTRYGAALYIAPENKYSISADIEKAYNDSANKYVNIGETVYISCTSDGAHTAVGEIVAAEGTTYTVETTSGELMMEETVNIYRSPEYTSSSRIGRGTVSRTAEIAVTGTGSVVALHVSDGDPVERGQLLFETVTGDLDGLYATGNEIVSEISGVVASVSVSAGGTVSKGDTILSIYPDDSLEIEIDVEEYDLGAIAVGDDVRVSFNWDEDGAHDTDGNVRMISYLSNASTSAAGEETSTSSSDAVYKGYVSFTPDESVRLGMTVIVTVPDAEEATATEETAETTE